MAVQHKNLTASQVHESKGISAASDLDFNFAVSGANNWDSLHYTEAVAASGASTVTFDDLDGVRELMITFNDLITNSSAGMWMQFSANNGSSYAGSDQYTTFNQDGTSIDMGTHTVIFIRQQSESGYTSGKMVISNFNQPLVSTVKGAVHYNPSANYGGSGQSASVTGAINIATAWNAFQISSGGPTITGRVTIEGIRG